MTIVLEAIGGLVFGLILGYTMIGPWFDRLERRRRLESRLHRWREMNKLAHPEDQLTEAQMKAVEEMEREYWEIH